MRTQIFPSKKVTFKKTAQPILTFTENDATPIKEVVSRSHQKDPKTFKSSSEVTREDKIILNERIIENLEKKVATLKETLKELAAEHEAQINNQTTQFENLKNLHHQEAEKKVAEAQAQHQKILEEAQNQSQTVLQEATTKSEAILSEARKNRTQLEQEAQEVGIKKGLEQGVEESRVETERLQELIKRTLGECIAERSRLIKRSEAHVIDLCLLMVKKVVKTISEQDRTLVIRTIKEALKRADGLVHITIRVNTIDWKLSEQTKKEFLKIQESIKNIVITEDPEIEPGGCVIESDFGAIDARLSSQLQELELAIREISPIQPIP